MTISAVAQREFTYICRLCGESKSSFGPVPDKLCDGCWELKTRIKMQPELARKVLKSLELSSKEDTKKWL